MGEMIPDAFYLLRWRLEYRDKKAKVSMWGDSSPIESEQAWRQTRNGLSRAQIEAKDIVTGNKKVIVDCPASDFRLFQWIGLQKINPRSIKINQKNIGIALWTNDKRIEAYEWGEVKIIPILQPEKQLKFTSD